MTRYVVGDVQGCYDDLRRLLDRVAFDPGRDKLWFAGDLVNRGGQSLKVLRFAFKHRKSVRAVLGNHDLHLLALAAGAVKRPERELAQVVAAPDADELIHWLRHQRLLKLFKKRKTILVHAGIHPTWKPREARARARELERLLQARDWEERIGQLYGNKPSWDLNLTGSSRRRAIAATLTRMRYLDAEGRFDAEHKGPPGTQRRGLKPWFAWPQERKKSWRVLFGHWATLGYHVTPSAVCLDSGCVWGGALTAVDLRRPERPFQVR
ncbi:MAG: symmetrical bis(5'-nucleosyl)-tetraphosphatase [Pseudomonadota bacterium]